LILTREPKILPNSKMDGVGFFWWSNRLNEETRLCSSSWWWWCNWEYKFVEMMNLGFENWKLEIEKGTNRFILFVMMMMQVYRYHSVNAYTLKSNVTRSNRRSHFEVALMTLSRHWSITMSHVIVIRFFLFFTFVIN